MNVKYFNEGLECLMYCGQKLTPEQKVIIENSLIVLQNENRLSSMHFWGRINAITSDYYIAFGYTQDCLKDRKFFYTVDGYQWMMLPFVHSTKIFQATILCREPFIGDPILVTTVELDPTFEIDNYQVISANMPEKVKLKEEERLAAIVFIITEECAICPRGALYKLTDGRVIPNQMFRGLNDLEVENMSNYQIFRLPRCDLKHNLLKRSDYNYAIDFLDCIADVIPLRQAFSLNLMRSERLVIIKSCIWSGMTFFHKLNSRKHGFCYFGDGKKNYDLLFMY
ncbi:PREDICTED: radial spoke head protein 9 homolog [Rhagoletis zephyria]|uniref:radial spoke head protein 9 homolog n=1 Tax=Rhagoletis zephyria TaxID=28612 RepID=UPI0008115804|nr:PREDICTED: radial spoke head protein 9 homolog [Rhagoletis zephyria]XP_036327689.1 radial spoke head protein 9 homolog [Rhagoletis pomonella]